MIKKTEFITLILLFAILLLIPNRVLTMDEKTAPKDYQFKLFLARGELSLAGNYHDTAIKNFQKALDINAYSPEARDLYEKAVVLKKLGIISEAAEAG